MGYAYPWDFDGDPAAAHRARALGLDAVAVAAAYHTVRSASPLHPTRRLTEVPHAASYVPVRAEAWRGRRLRPAPATWLPDRPVRRGPPRTEAGRPRRLRLDGSHPQQPPRPITP
ncbi:hypothetical protein GCM10020295_18990 [Streptomyces cinereospinus]